MLVAMKTFCWTCSKPLPWRVVAASRRYLFFNDGMRLALETIDSGCAWRSSSAFARHRRIASSPVAEYVEPLIKRYAGWSCTSTNQARPAAAGGAPQSLAAGISIQVRLGDEVARPKHCCPSRNARGTRFHALGYANEVGKLSGWRSKRLNLTLPRFRLNAN